MTFQTASEIEGTWSKKVPFAREFSIELTIKGSAHETEKIVRLGLPRILRLKENAPELDYSSFYVTTGTGTPAALLRRI